MGGETNTGGLTREEQPQAESAKSSAPETAREQQDNQQEERLDTIVELLGSIKDLDKPLDAPTLIGKIEGMITTIQSKLPEGSPELTVTSERNYLRTEDGGEHLLIAILCNQEAIVNLSLAHKKDNNGKIEGLRDITQRDLEERIIIGLRTLRNKLRKEAEQNLGI